MARRSIRPLELSKGTRRPHGPRWDRWRALLVADWWRAGRKCYYCSHGFNSPGLIEAAHLISPIVRPDLAWSRDNLVPAHAAGKNGVKRCPECHLNCNWIAHNAPDMRRDSNGFDLPFTPELMAREAATAGKNRWKNGKPGKFGGNSVETLESASDAGRIW